MKFLLAVLVAAAAVAGLATPHLLVALPGVRADWAWYLIQSYVGGAP